LSADAPIAATPPVSVISANGPKPGQPPAARNAPPVPASSSSATILTLNSTASIPISAAAFAAGVGRGARISAGRVSIEVVMASLYACRVSSLMRQTDARSLSGECALCAAAHVEWISDPQQDGEREPLDSIPQVGAFAQIKFRRYAVGQPRPREVR